MGHGGMAKAGTLMASPIKLTPRLQKLLTDKMQADRETEGAADLVDPADAMYRREVTTAGIEEARRRGVPVELQPGTLEDEPPLASPDLQSLLNTMTPSAKQVREAGDRRYADWKRRAANATGTEDLQAVAEELRGAAQGNPGYVPGLLHGYVSADDSPQTFDLGGRGAYTTTKKEMDIARALDRSERGGPRLNWSDEARQAPLSDEQSSPLARRSNVNKAVLRWAFGYSAPITSTLPDPYGVTGETAPGGPPKGSSAGNTLEVVRRASPAVIPSTAQPRGRWGLEPDEGEYPTEEDFPQDRRYLAAETDNAMARYEMALKRLGLRQQMEDVVSWSKSSGGSTSRTHNPLGAIELGGKMESEATRRAAAMLEANMKAQRELGERRVIIRGQQYDTTGTVTEAEKMRAKAALGAQLRNIADDLDALKRMDPDFDRKSQNLIDYASATISTGLSQGVLTDPDAARKAQQLATDRFQFITKGGAAVLRSMADSTDKNVEADIAQRGGRRVTGGR